MTPLVTFEGQAWDTASTFTVITENETICTSDTFPEAILLVLANYYVFDIKYHPKVKYTLSFIQNALLHVKDKGKLPQRLLSLVTKLH